MIWNGRCNKCFRIIQKHFLMNTLFSELKKSDLIYEDFSQSSPSASPQASPSSLSASNEAYFPSKRAMLRDVNRIYRQQMWDMDAAFRDTAEKWNSSKVTFTHNNSAQMKQHNNSPIFNAEFLDTAQTNAHRYLAGSTVSSEGESNDERSTHEGVVQMQHQIRDQIQAITKLLGKRIISPPLELEKIQRKSPIKWDILLKDQNTTIRQLLKTDLNSDKKDYIAYTQQTSSHDCVIQNKDKKRKKKGNSHEASAPTKKQQGNNAKNQYKMNLQSKIYNGIEARIINSPCTINKGIHATEIQKTSQLFKRLSQEKNQRDNLLRSIKMQLK